jgi:hypothetical protein
MGLNRLFLTAHEGGIPCPVFRPDTLKEGFSMKNPTRFLGIITIGAIIAFTVAGCKTYIPAPVPKNIEDQIGKIKLYEPQPGEVVKTLEIERTGSITSDLNNHEGGAWYKAHQNKIVSIEPILRTTMYGPVTLNADIWRIGYFTFTEKFLPNS